MRRWDRADSGDVKETSVEFSRERDAKVVLGEDDGDGDAASQARRSMTNTCWTPEWITLMSMPLTNPKSNLPVGSFRVVHHGGDTKPRQRKAVSAANA